jgi:multimeric flavodoxin WrbA
LYRQPEPTQEVRKETTSFRGRHRCVGFDSINHFFLIGQMIIPGSSYWNIGIGRAKGEVEQDEEGLRTTEALGQNMAWLLKKVNRVVGRDECSFLCSLRTVAGVGRGGVCSRRAQ